MSTVHVRLSGLAHGSAGAKSVFAVMLEVTQDGFYKLGTGKGILRGLCVLSLFDHILKSL
jgi:hypothetical protein